MDHTPPTALPVMSYTGVEAKPMARMTPTEEEIRDRAHEIWLRREGEPGNPALDWLQAELELTAELRSGKPIKARVAGGRGAVSSQVETRPEPARDFARGDAQWSVPRRAAG
jgi:hypothetical protein